MVHFHSFPFKGGSEPFRYEPTSTSDQSKRRHRRHRWREYTAHLEYPPDEHQARLIRRKIEIDWARFVAMKLAADPNTPPKEVAEALRAVAEDDRQLTVLDRDLMKATPKREPAPKQGPSLATILGGRSPR